MMFLENKQQHFDLAIFFILIQYLWVQVDHDPFIVGSLIACKY